MTLFEYLVVAFALLYASAAMRLIGGLPSALNRSRRFWTHVALILLTLLLIAFNFWTFWSLHEIEWTLPRFVYALFVPSLLYFCASVLVPENPADIQSWREYYFAIRVRYFGGLALWVIVLSGAATMLLELPLLHPARLGHLAGLLLALTGVVSTSQRIHGAIVLIMILLVCAASMTIGAQPGWLTG